MSVRRSEGSARLALLGFVALACAGPDAAGVPILAQGPPAQASRVERLAFEIHARDIAAWRATDQVRDAGIHLDQEGIRGWLVLLEDSKATVRFIGKGSTPVARIDVLLDVATSASGEIAIHAGGAALSATETAMWQALRLANSAEFRRCSDHYNPVVLRDPDSENWLVYLLAASTDPVVFVGGHHRFLVSPDGKEILQATALSVSCLTTSVDPELKAFGFLQTASEEPLETSVLLSLQIHRPVYFRVPGGSTWMAVEGRLTLLRDGPAP